MEVQDLIITLIGIASIVGIGIAIWQIAKNNPGVEVGKVISAFIVKYPITILMILGGAICLVEAIVAATVHIHGEQAFNPFARYFLHTAGAAASIIGSFTYIKEFKNAFNTFASKASGISMFFTFIRRLFLALIMTMLAYIIPFTNLVIIANAYKQVQLLNLFLKSAAPEFMYANDRVIDDMEALGLPSNYSVFDGLSYTVFASLVVVIIHYLIITYEAFKTLDVEDDVMTKAFVETAVKAAVTKPIAKPEEKVTEKTDETSSIKTEEKSAEKPAEKSTEKKDGKMQYEVVLRDIITFACETKFVEKFIADCTKIIQDLEASQDNKAIDNSFKIVNVMATLAKKIKEVKKDDETSIEALRKEINLNLQKSPTAGGFGVSLPLRKN